jgi:hypothetical protein
MMTGGFSLSLSASLSCCPRRRLRDLMFATAMARWNQTPYDSARDKEEARKKILNAAKRYGIEVSDDDRLKKAP